jgi:gamma-glutamylcyclotransferase (GGCT)/AIG2-like uncharacterized protein YtfP
MVKEEKGLGVYGELYKVDELTLKRLDRLEGHPDFYRRSDITVIDLETGSPVNCQAYIYNGGSFKNSVPVSSF